MVAEFFCGEKVENKKNLSRDRLIALIGSSGNSYMVDRFREIFALRNLGALAHSTTCSPNSLPKLRAMVQRTADVPLAYSMRSGI